jgi:hypothetical protein
VPAGLSGAVLAVLGLVGPEVAGAVLAGGGLDGAVLAGGGPAGAVLAGDGLELGGLGLEELGLGLAAWLAQGVGLGLAALAPACVAPDGLGLGTGAVPAWGGLEELELAGPVVAGLVLAAGGLAGLVLTGLGLAGLVTAGGGLAGLVLTGGVLAGLLVPAGLVPGGGTARADVPGVQLAAGCPWPWPPWVAPATPAAPLPLPLPLGPGSPVPAGAAPAMEFRTAPACEITCRPNGVSAEALMASRTVTAATVVTRRSRAMYRPSGAPSRRWTSPGTVCSQAETESRLPRAYRATQEHAAISQATGSGCGVVSLERIRSRPSPAGSAESTAACSAPRRTSSKSPECWLMPQAPAPRAGPSWRGPHGS